MWQSLSEHEVLKAVSERIREMRVARGQTQSALARQAGIALPTMQRLESGKGLPKIEILIRVLRSLRKLDDLEVLLALPAAVPIEPSSCTLLVGSDPHGG